MYHHITRDERVALAALKRAGHSLRDIAKGLGVHHSTLSREMRRNPTERGTYHAAHADVLARRRRIGSKRDSRKIENDRALERRIEKRLHPLVSPEVVAHDERVSPETIYAWIYRSRPELLSLLPQRGRKRRRYGSKRSKKQGWTRYVRPIDSRPASADARSRVGHFEGDTVKGKNGALLTHTDRKSRFEVVHKVPSEEANCAHAAIKADRYLAEASSITYDRGSTFALWRMIERDTGASVFFAGAHHPWERGTNENANGRLRRVYPKGSDFSMISDKDVRNTVWLMNHTRRKCLNWRTPCEVFGRCCTSN